MKKNYLWLGPIIVLALALAIIIFLRLASPEDTWLCQDGQWVKHGQPAETAPSTSCGDIADRDLTNDDSAERCLNGGGDWLADYQECENISRDLCEELDGRFDAPRPAATTDRILHYAMPAICQQLRQRKY